MSAQLHLLAPCGLDCSACPHYAAFLNATKCYAREPIVWRNA